MASSSCPASSRSRSPVSSLIVPWQLVAHLYDCCWAAACLLSLVGCVQCNAVLLLLSPLLPETSAHPAPAGDALVNTALSFRSAGCLLGGGPCRC